MDPSFWVALIEKSATVALAVFAIWVLTKEYKERIRESQDRLEAERHRHKDERDQQAAVVDRNTEAWIAATKTMVEIASGMTLLANAVDTSRQGIIDIKVLLAEGRKARG